MKTRKRHPGLFLAASATALLASCATMDEDRYARADPASSSSVVYDTAYIAAVESMAAHRGVNVEWVNPPRVRAEDD